MTREDIELYMMGQYDGDVAVVERAIAEDPEAAAIAAEEARLELVLREAGAAATFCPGCDDLVRGERCGQCGTALRPGGYTVERVLVANAHGRMYVARDADGKQVALKELAFVQTPTLAALAAFEREAKVLRALEHPAIPRFLASFEEGAGVHLRYYLAQELVDGAPLDRLDDHWYDEAEVVALAKQVLAILVYLQGLSPMVIHRDVKPANLLRRADGSIALVDFGAAHVQGTPAASTAIGTFGYMPLEQLAGEVDATTDGYALGMTMLHLLTRQEPWRIAQERPALNVSAPLRAFLDKLVAPDRRARFASAKDALAALEALGERRARPRRSWRPVLYAAAAVALAGSGFGVYELASSGPPAEGTLRVSMEPSDTHGVLYVDDVWQSVVVGTDEIPLPAGRHVVEVRFYRDNPCTAEIEIEPGHVRWLSCAVKPPLPPTAPPRPIEVVPLPVGEPATLRVLLDRSDSVMPMWIDGTRIDRVSDRQELPVRAGPHHVLVESERGGCIRDITAVAGKKTEIACHVDRGWLDLLGAPLSPDDLQ